MNYGGIEQKGKKKPQGQNHQFLCGIPGVMDHALIYRSSFIVLLHSTLSSLALLGLLFLCLIQSLFLLADSWFCHPFHMSALLQSPYLPPPFFLRHCTISLTQSATQCTFRPYYMLLLSFKRYISAFFLSSLLLSFLLVFFLFSFFLSLLHSFIFTLYFLFVSSLLILLFFFSSAFKFPSFFSLLLQLFLSSFP